jgi:hypothetical protein
MAEKHCLAKAIKAQTPQDYGVQGTKMCLLATNQGGY